MKKLLSILMLFFLIFSIFPINKSFAADTKIYFVLKDSVVFQDSDFTLEVHIDNVKNLYAVGFDLIYDNKFVKFEKIELGTLLNPEGSTTLLLAYRDNPEEGRNIIGISRSKDSPGIEGSGIVAYIKLNAISKGETNVDFENVYLKDPSTLDMKSTSESIKVTVQDKDLVPPELTVDAINETYDSKATLKGKTEPTAKVKINDKEITVSEDGSFTLDVDLIEGENKFVVIATDPAGNETKVTKIIVKMKPIKIILVIGSKTVFVNGQPKELDAPPFVDKASGRTLIPIRIVTDAISATIEWEASTRKVTIKKGTLVIEMWIDNPVAKINGVMTPIDFQAPKLSPKIVSGRTFLPLRFVSENLGCSLGWDGPTQTITLTYPKP
jgi:hypothetical protein